MNTTIQNHSRTDQRWAGVIRNLANATSIAEWAQISATPYLRERFGSALSWSRFGQVDIAEPSERLVTWAILVERDVEAAAIHERLVKARGEGLRLAGTDVSRALSLADDGLSAAFVDLVMKVFGLLRDGTLALRSVLPEDQPSLLPDGVTLSERALDTVRSAWRVGVAENSADFTIDHLRDLFAQFGVTREVLIDNGINPNPFFPEQVSA